MSSDFHHRRWLIFFVLVLYMLIMQTSSPPLASVVCKFVTLVGRWSYSLHTGTTPPLLRKVGWPAQRKRHIVFCYSFGRTHPPKLSCFCSLSLSLHGFYGELSAISHPKLPLLLFNIIYNPISWEMFKPNPLSLATTLSKWNWGALVVQHHQLSHSSAKRTSCNQDRVVLSSVLRRMYRWWNTELWPHSHRRYSSWHRQM